MFTLRKLFGGWASRRTSMVAVVLMSFSAGASANTTLADTPVYSTSNVPANLMVALSVEFPTGTVAAYSDSGSYAWSTTSPYLGYFDAAKCYDYNSANGYFVPVSTAPSSAGSCAGHWSGNMLNWALMTSLDEFRSTLTGGNRVIDTATNTVLERSNLNSQATTGNFPVKTVSSPAMTVGTAPYSTATTDYIRSATYGTQFQISNNSSFSTSGSGKVATFNAEVQVCVSGLLESNCTGYPVGSSLPTNYKPEGLIQQNYTKIRVGVSAYAFTTGDTYPNGVVRALLRDNGPTTYNGFGTRQTNPNTEWSATDGTFYANPDATDSTYGTAPGGRAFTSSGAINYINGFGYKNGYETYDTVGDLYWSTLAYYMQVPLDSSYSSALSSSNSMDVNYPVFTGQPGTKNSAGTVVQTGTVNDPIAYTCQSNAIVMIGDVHTWNDTRVPSTAPQTDSGSGGIPLSPLVPGGTVAVGMDASAYVTKLGNLPLLEATSTTAASRTMASYAGTTALGTIWEPDSTPASYNMAGMAYYAHTNDIRADLNNTQNVSTYVVDVLEPGDYDGTSAHPLYSPGSLGSGGPSMYWLAAKYGGFNNINNDGVPANQLTWHTNSSSGSSLRPDNYFPGNAPTLIQSGLQQIFNNIATNASQTGSGLATPTDTLASVSSGAAPYYAPVTGYPVYTTVYAPATWTGDVSGYISTSIVPGTVSAASGSTPWHAQLQLDTLTQATNSSKAIVGWNTGRRVVTWNGSKGVAFRYANLSTGEQNAVNQSASGSNFVNYVRGDKSQEGVTFRVRSHILGDIVDSGAVLVQGPMSTSYTEANNPGYTAFSQSVTNRMPVVYVGSNDGMLHAFEADFLNASASNPVTGGGSELFAYVPSAVFAGPNSTPLVDGLPALANLNGVSSNNFNHHFYVDATPQVADVDFTYMGSGNTAPITSATTANWHTLLVGGLGKGGRSVYALDVTSVPAVVDTTSSAAAETTEASKVLWEFTDSDLGYTYGAPLIVKTRKYGWVVLVTSGYNNNATSDAQAGHGLLYVLNAKTGAIIQKIDTGVGSAAKPAGLTQATAYEEDVSDGTIDQVYAGDLLGNVWRFDLSEQATVSGVATGPYPSPTLLATLADSTGTAQPVTTAPRIEEAISANGLGTVRWVFVGTGQFLDISDLSTTQQQTMYALLDGTGTAPSTTNLPLTRSKLAQDTNLTQGVTLTSQQYGWYYDLTHSAGSGGGTERIVINPASNAGAGIVAWGTAIPSSDPCSLAGALYATSFSGQTELETTDGTLVPYLSLTSAPTSVELFQTSASGSASGTGGNNGGGGSGSTGGTGSGSSGAQTLIGTSTSGGGIQLNNVNPGTSAKPVARVNWREILH